MEYSYQDIEKVLLNVRISTQLFVTKQGKVYSSEAEHFLDCINKYSQYCIPEEKENWEKFIRNITYSNYVLDPINDEEIISILTAYIDAGRVMEQYANTKSWEDVMELIKLRATWGLSCTILTKALLRFSPIGVDFADKLEDWMLNKQEIKKEYTKAKLRQDKRRALAQELANALSERSSM